jgi:hypothetical protein
MSMEGVYEILLQGLAGSLSPTALNYVSPEAARAELQRRTGKDFGWDVEAWRACIHATRREGIVATGLTRATSPPSE